MISLSSPAGCGDNGGNHAHPEKRTSARVGIRTEHPAGGQCLCMVSGGTQLGQTLRVGGGSPFLLQPTSFQYHGCW